MIKLASIIFKVGGVVLLGATVGVFSHWRYTAGKESANTVWQSRWDKRNIADVELMARYQREAREEEQRRIKAIIQVNEDANLQLNAARADAARAKSVIISLRNTVRYMQQKLAADNARQEAIPTYCWPTCSQNLSKEISSWRPTLTGHE